MMRARILWAALAAVWVFAGGREAEAAKKPKPPKATFALQRLSDPPPLRHAAWSPLSHPEIDVFLPTGGVFHRRALFELPGGNMPLDVALNFHGDQDFDGGFGKRWHSSLDGRVIPQPNGDVIYEDERGAEFLFTARGLDWDTPAGICALLAAARKGKKQKVKEYHLVDADRSIRVFDKKGRWVRWIRPDGGFYAFKRFKDGRWKLVTSSERRKIKAKYDKSRRLLRITDHAKRNYGFAYDLTGHLVRIARPQRAIDQQPLALAYTYQGDDLATVVHTTGDTLATLTYQPAGVLQKIASPVGDTTFAIGATETAVTARSGVQHTFAYDANGQRTRHDVRLTAGGTATTSYEFDNQGRLVREVLPSGLERVREYPNGGDPRELWNVLIHRDRSALFPRTPDLVWTYTYRPETSELASKLYPDSARTDWTYDAAGNVLTMRLPGMKTEAVPAPPFERPLERYEYNALNRRTAIVYGDGTRDEFVYRSGKKSSDELVRAIRDVGTGNDPDTGRPFWNETTDFSYDAAGNIIRERHADNTTTLFQYDELDSILRLTDENGTRTDYTYDSAYRLVNQTRPLLDADGQAIGSGQVSRSTKYDAVGNPVEHEVHNGFETRRTTAQFDVGNDRPSSQTDAVGVISRVTYDEHDRIATQTLAAGTGREVTVRYSYDVNRNRTRVADGNGLGPTNVYDDFDRLVRTQSEEGVTTNLGLDERGRTISRTVRDAAGKDAQRERYEYDFFGNLTRVEADRFVNPAGPVDVEVTTHCYDLRGARTLTVDPCGRTKRFTYDGRGHVVRTEEVEMDFVREHVYDIRERLVTEREISGASLPSPMTKETRFTYDAVGKLTGTTDPAGGTQVFELDTAGNLFRATDVGGRTTVSVNDGDGNLRSTTSTQGATTLETSHTYDVAARLVESTGSDGRTLRYTYDELGQTTEVDLIPDTGPPIRVTTYTYDDAGNELTRQTGQGRVIETEYDDDYNVLTVTAPNLIQRIEVDALGRIISGASETGRGIIGVQRLYDSRGNITSETQVGNTVNALFTDGNKPTQVQEGQGATYDLEYGGAAELNKVRRNSNDFLTFERAPGGRMLTRIDHPRQSTTFEYDELGRTVRTANTTPEGVDTDWRSTWGDDGEFLSQQLADGSVVETFQYDEHLRPTGVQRTRPGNGAPAVTVDQIEYDPLLDRPIRIQSTRDGVLPPPTAKSSGVLSYDDLGRIATVDAEVYTYAPDLGATNAFEYRTGFAQRELTVALDPLGRVSTVSEAVGGAIVAEYDYDVWDRPLLAREQDSFGTLLTRARIFWACTLLWEGPPPGSALPGFAIRYGPLFMRPGHYTSGLTAFGDDTWQLDCRGKWRQSFHLPLGVLQEVNYDHNVWGVSLFEFPDINGDLQPFAGPPSLQSLPNPPGAASSNATGMIFDWLGPHRDPNLPRGLPFVGKHDGGGGPAGPGGPGGGGAPQPRGTPFKPHPGGWGILANPRSWDDIENEKCERAFNGMCKLIADGNAMAAKAAKRRAEVEARADELRRDARFEAKTASILEDSAVERAADLAKHLGSVEAMDFAADVALAAASLGGSMVGEKLAEGAARHALASSQLRNAGTAISKRFAGANVSRARGEIAKKGAAILGSEAAQTVAQGKMTSGLNTSFGLFTQWIITASDLVTGHHGYEGEKAEIEGDLGAARLKKKIAKAKEDLANQIEDELFEEILDIVGDAADNNRILARAVSNAAAWMQGDAGASKQAQIDAMLAAQTAAGIR